MSNDKDTLVNQESPAVMETMRKPAYSIARANKIKRVLWVILILNVAVAMAKFVYGTLTGAMSMRADGIHSLFDGIGNVVGIAGITAANRPADTMHPYGHEKYETFASLFIGVLLIVAAYNVASGAIVDLLEGSSQVLVDTTSFVVMLVTLAINIVVTVWERAQGTKLASEVLVADSRHTLSDVLVTCAVLAGLCFVKAGYPIADSILSLLVAVCILASSVGIFKQVNFTFSDSSRIASSDIAACAEAVCGVNTVHEIRTRGSETAVYADLHVLVDQDCTVNVAHSIANNVERSLKQRWPQIADVLVHIEPDTPHERLEASAKVKS